jgi:hypothetical protein
MSGILQALLAGFGGAATDEYFKYVTMLLPGNGTNGAQNNTFLDSSTNNFTITRNGNTTQGTFAPFGSNWSNYFDGSGDSLAVTSATAFDFSADFTVEGWFNFSQINQVSGATVLFSTDVVNRFQINTLASGNVIQFYENSGTASISVSNPIVVGTWNHIALVRTGTTIGLFVNGSRIGSYTSSFSFDVGVLYIGQQTPGYSNHWFNGYASNVRVIKGSGPYDATQSTLTVPTSPLTAITNTSLLTCQSNRFIDNSTNAFTITRNGDVSVQRFSPFSPTAPYAAGTDGGSGYWDGTGDYLTVADNAALDMGSSNFTIEGWIFPTVSSSGSVGIFSKRANSGTTAGVLLYYDGAGLTPSLLIESGGSWVINQASSIAFTANQWNHFAAVRNGSSFVLYINGTSGATGTSAGSITDNSAAFAIGAWAADGTGIISSSYISNFRVVKGTAVYTANFTPPTAPLTAITNTSLLTNFTNAGIIDNAMMNNLETVGNAQISTAQSKFGGASIAFDGTGDWLAGPPTPQTDLGSGDFTIEAWLYRTASGAASDSGMVSRGAPSTLNGFVFAYTSANVLTFNFNYSGAIVTGATAISINTWTHVAVSRNGNTFRLFVNGVVDATATSTNSQTTNASDVFYVGRAGFDSNRIVTGYLDDVRLTKGYARYTANFTAPTAPFPLQ